MTSAQVRSRRAAAGIQLITIDNGPLNLITTSLVENLSEALDRLEADPDVHALVVTGSGDRAFSAGSDLAEFDLVRDNVVGKKSAPENDLFRRLELFPKPTIAAVNGAAVGGGLEMALCCDLRIFSDIASCGFPEINAAVYPGSGGTYRILSHVALGRAFELIYSGKLISAERAYELGIATHLVPADQCVTSAIDLAADFAAKSPTALAATKAALLAARGRRWEEVLPLLLELTERVFETSEARHFTEEFLARRANKRTPGRLQQPSRGAAEHE